MRVRNFPSFTFVALILLAFALGCGGGAGSETRGDRGQNDGAESRSFPKDRSRSVPAKSVSEVMAGRVVGVSDGDTIVLRTSANGVQTKVRLATIDCPEKTQDFGVKAKESLASMVFGKDVEVEVRSVDRYGRTVGVVRVGGTDVNLEQIKRGFAWHYTQYSKEQPEAERAVYADAERSARENRVGLWVDPSPVAPWNFRRGKRNQSSYAE